jgi:excisionase family DNA binding protein
VSDSDTWLTVGQAAQRLGVSDTTVRQYADSGQLKTARLPSKHRRISAESVEKLRREIYEAPDADES